ncbi:Uncharacterised protein [Legionella pneumophila]|nr:Uncharacterised protein [Legionella pneumophila]
MIQGALMDSDHSINTDSALVGVIFESILQCIRYLYYGLSEP